MRWSENPAEMSTNALNPADILDISVDEANRVILVVVPHDQLSLAIGKRGQNARLASKLMVWNIDIKSDVELTGGGSPDAAPADAPADMQQELIEHGQDSREFIGGGFGGMEMAGIQA